MFWRINTLDESQRRALAEVSSGPKFTVCYFRASRHFRWVVLGVLAGSLLTGLGALIAWDMAEVLPRLIALALLVLACLWTLTAWVELLRGLRSDVKPFLLVTPKVLLRADYAHGELEGYRLGDATDFRSAETYTGTRQDYAGRYYTFVFPEKTVAFKIKERRQIEVMEEVLARAGGAAAKVNAADSAGMELLPGDGGTTAPVAWRFATDPFGLAWAGVAGMLCLLGLIALLIHDVFFPER